MTPPIRRRREAPRHIGKYPLGLTLACIARNFSPKK